MNTWPEPALGARLVEAATAIGRIGAWLALGVLTLAGAVLPAAALDLTPEGGRDDETIAAGERRAREGLFASRELVAVSDRDRPEFTPQGLRVGNFLVFPSIETRLVHDDNVFLSPTGQRRDFRLEIEPLIRIRSQFPRHAFEASFGGKFVEYQTYDRLNYADAHARMGVSLHIDHAHTLSVSVLSALEHQDLLDPFAPMGGRERVPVWRNRASIGLTRDAGRLYGTISATIESRDYQDITATDGTAIDQDARDMATASSELKVGYRFSPGFELQTKLRMLRQLNRGDGITDADATGVDGLVGLSFETGPLLRWRLLGGYGLRDFDQPGLANVATYLADAEVKWLPSQRVTVTASARRAFMETTGLEAAGVIETSVGGRVDVEAWHNVVLNIGAEWKRAEFIGIDRTDEAAIARAGVEYHLSRNWLLSLTFEHIRRDSTIDAYDLTRNVVSVGARLRF